MPELRQLAWEQIIPKYLSEVKPLNSEPAKSQRFTLLMNDLFGIQPGFIEDYVSGIEKYVRIKQKDRIIKGRIDNLFGNLIIEFERDLAKTKDEAKEQIKKYVACLWSQETPSQRAPYLCIAGDGINFCVYSPAIEDPIKIDIKPEEIQLEIVEQANFLLLKPQEVYFWLDRYFLRKEILPPKTENIVKDFGVKSHAFKVASQDLLSLWKNLKNRPQFKVIYEGWGKYLRIVYGTSMADEELFIRHTYLATLAKLMAWCRFTEEKEVANDAQVLSLLQGQFFKDRGIENFLEEDFFSWLARNGARDDAIKIVRLLLSLFRNYNLRELSEDVLKSLYQELVDPKTRHDLGEYYTPDWLAHLMIQKIMGKSPKTSLLDPACGSGTFLYLSIREKRDCLGDSFNTLKHILNSIVGVDIHPLAVIVAKTNYILALGDLLKKRKAKINIPIYLSDTVKLPELEKRVPLGMPVIPSYYIELDGKSVYFPKKLVDTPTLYDEAIEAVKDYAVQNKGKQITEEGFLNFLNVSHPVLTKDTAIAKSLFRIVEILKGFIESNRDSIWAFILKNIYKPLFLKGKFDIVIGNPPWLSYRYVELPKYQKFLKEQITQIYNLLSGRAELITHLELGTLFFIRTADLYLKQSGNISFVLPRSIFVADQHDALRKGMFKGVNLTLSEIWDLEEVKPLFNVPACVLFAEKQTDKKILYPIVGHKFKGDLPRRNSSLDEAKENLHVEDVQFFLHKRGKRSFWSLQKSIIEGEVSYYKKHFYQGATIVPRSFWFVDVKSSPLGFDPSLPPLETSKHARKQAKSPYKGVIIKGSVESQFLYATFLSTDLLPFGHLDYRLVVLPIEPSTSGYRLINSDEARKRGFLNLAEWLEKVEEEWERHREIKAKDINAIQWLDYRKKLTSQSPKTKYWVLYNTSGATLCACVLENKPIKFEINKQEVVAGQFVVDHMCYYLQTSLKLEAYYLNAILNTAYIDQLIKPMQTRGQFGPRHIHKKVLEFPIPKFDPSDPRHLKLAELGEECSKKVNNWLESGGPGKIKSIGKLRTMVRKMLDRELKEIDAIVQKILST